MNVTHGKDPFFCQNLKKLLFCNKSLFKIKINIYLTHNSMFFQCSFQDETLEAFVAKMPFELMRQMMVFERTFPTCLEVTFFASKM